MITEELNHMLLEFLKVNQDSLKAVWHVWIDGCLDKILFEFDEVSLVVEAEIDYDTIVFHVIDNNELTSYSAINASHSEPWTGFIGKTFGWGWVAFNQQNYLDGVLLSFDGIKPNLFLNVMASSIKVSITHEISEDALLHENK